MDMAAGLTLVMAAFAFSAYRDDWRWMIVTLIVIVTIVVAYAIFRSISGAADSLAKADAKRKKKSEAAKKKDRDKALIALCLVVCVILGIYTLVKLANKFVPDPVRIGTVATAPTVVATVPVAAAHVARRSSDSTFHLVATSDWSDPVNARMDQCVHVQREDSVAFQMRFEDGSTVEFPKSIVPDETTTELVAANGNVLSVYTADGYGRFSIQKHGPIQVRVLGAAPTVFKVEVEDI